MRIGKISGMALGLAFAVTSFAIPAYGETTADEALGVWQRTKQDWLVEFKMCEDNPELLCGEVVAGEGTDKGTGESVIGVQMLYNLARHATKDDRWVGTMYNPGDGNEYAGTVRVLNDGRIKMSGCMMRIMCRSEKWPGATADQLASLAPAEEEAVMETASEAVEAASEAVMDMAEDAMEAATEE
ncbi:MAG: DUF2147 domain-containing protein [Hyphomonadaceae bacterium]